MADLILMVKGGHKLARRRIPELGAVIRARRQEPGTVRAERRVKERTEMCKGSDELARSRIPKVGAMIRTCRENPGAVRTKGGVLDGSLMDK